MDKELLKKTFREYKKAAGLAYAITNPDNLGDCMSCVNYALSEKYGEESKGIWAKHWHRGMNASGSLENAKQVWIAHDLDEELAAKFYEVFGKNYNITPSAYDPYKCFTLYEKDTEVYEISYTEFWNGKWNTRTDHYAYTDLESAMSRLKGVTQYMGSEEGMVKDATIKKLF